MSLGNSLDAQQKSLELMEKALEVLIDCTFQINPNNTLTLFNMASTYYEMDEFAKAINYYQLLVNSNRINDYRVYFNLAMCYEKLKDNLKATENYQQALKLNPDFSSAVINYSNLLMSMGKQT
jgi:tetratricopeptide (TPR) repeat protein